jgi:hypothetical protein
MEFRRPTHNIVIENPQHFLISITDLILVLIITIQTISIKEVIGSFRCEQ